jgi:hypothetical protein
VAPSAARAVDTYILGAADAAAGTAQTTITARTRTRRSGDMGLYSAFCAIP